MNGPSILSSRRSGTSAADLAYETDVEFRSNKKFNKPSSVFSSNSKRFRASVPVSPAPNVYHPSQDRSGRGALLSLTGQRTATRKSATDRFYETPVPSSVRRGSPLGSSSFCSKEPRGLKLSKYGVDPTRYSPNISQTVPSLKNTSSAVFKSSAARSNSVREASNAGPGSYFASGVSATSATHATPRAVSSSFRSRSPRMSQKESATPPPGAHGTPATTFTSKGGAAPAFRSKSPRMKYNHPDTPAPGHYNAVDPSRRDSRQFSIPRTPRGNVTRGDPSDIYKWEGTNVSSRVGAHRGAPAKVVSVNRSSTPGPGSYNASTVLTNSRASSAVFRSHTHGLHTREGVPGPGTHDISYETRFPSGRSHSMSSADRFKQRPNNTPGPGAFIKSYSSFLN